MMNHESRRPTNDHAREKREKQYPFHSLILT
jgi:hypothetical protein